MRLQIVMDGSGDTRHQFDANDPVSLADAADRFRELTQRGYRAVAFKGSDASGELIKSFDPTIEKTMFIPRLVGG